MRKVKDAIDIVTKEKFYFKGHAKATHLSNGINVEDAINTKVEEAPSDSHLYARTNNSWVPISGLEDLLSYGIQWEKEATSPICTRIGNPLLHKELPIQSQYKGCVYDFTNNEFKYWLNPNDWSLKDDGTAAILDGTDGDVCVHTPKFYGKSGEKDGKYWVRISLTQIDSSWIEIPEMYIGAYRSTVDRTNSLARSIINTSFCINLSVLRVNSNTRRTIFVRAINTTSRYQSITNIRGFSTTDY